MPIGNVYYDAAALASAFIDPAIFKEKPVALPTDAHARKEYPITRGVLDYFPDAIAAVAHVSHVGNQQHNPGEELHWAREKSTDHADCIGRHLLDRGTFDHDGVRHSAKLAWRALALLQLEIEAVQMEPAHYGRRHDDFRDPTEEGGERDGR